jgi:uncharacterized protein (TIGR02001 family)
VIGYFRERRRAEAIRPLSRAGLGHRGDRFMKNAKSIFAAAALAAAAIVSAAAPASAQMSAQADVVSRYIWRGFDLFAPNNAAFQPSLTYTFGESGFSANVWTSFALGDRAVYRADDEIDLTVTYAFKTPESLALAVGFTHYGWYSTPRFSFKRDTTQEFFASAGLPSLPLEPSLTVYYDVNLGSGLYALLKIGRAVPLGGATELRLSAGLGYNAGQFIAGSGLSDLSLGASLPFKWGRLTFAPSINYTFVFLDELWFGLSVIY